MWNQKGTARIIGQLRTSSKRPPVNHGRQKAGSGEENMTQNDIQEK